MKFRVLIAVICFILPCLSYLSADIYRWTDKQGTTHFGNSCPVRCPERESGFQGGRLRSCRQRARLGARREKHRGHHPGTRRRPAAREGGPQAGRRDKKPAPPTQADIITREKERLEKKILELEQKPLEFFGSQQNKRVRIGYYEYRLQALMADPDNYFKNPEPFEGNVPVPDKGSSN